ncbi:hypothetical protein V2A60_005556 [Cordyceps javanica]
MDRVTSIATASKYGARRRDQARGTPDYVVLGDRAGGPGKLQVINELELETITEDEFFGHPAAGAWTRTSASAWRTGGGPTTTSGRSGRSRRRERPRDVRKGADEYWAAHRP